MTDAQIRYHQMVESKRHNLAQENLSRYSTDAQLRGTVYSADSHAAAQRYSADTNAKASKYSADINSATQRYASDQSAATQKYAADLNAATAQARIALDRQVQLVKNSLEAKRVRLEQLRTQAQNANTRAQTKKIFTDITNSVKNLELQAQELGLKQEAAKYSNALNKARKYESDAKTVNTWVKSANDAYTFVSNLYDDIVSSIHNSK